ncbi:hypothetical protein KCU71_g1797, partial [Aureobasidium melanogenum]
MKTAEETMPGGRWLSVPGTNFESAAYALAVGTAATVSNKRPLDWSGSTAERQRYDAAELLCNAHLVTWLKKEGAKFDPQRPMSLTPLSLVIESWNARMLPTIKVHISCDGQNMVVPSSGHDGYKSVYIRQNGLRWEGYSYFQDPATTRSPVKAANAFSTITQIDIKPTADTEQLIDARATAFRLSQNPWEEESIESKFNFLRGTSETIARPIEALFRFIEVLDVSRNDTIRPTVDRVCSDLRQAGFTIIELLAKLDSLATNQEKESIMTGLDGSAVHEKEQQVMQKKQEDAEQVGEEDAEQRKRKEAETAAAAYAAQDRNDSCSDSD